jgi:catechol 2,3-dioxygenase-like lactoylglutathione lyase family enzyme
MILSIGVSDMPMARAFYEDKLGLKGTTDYARAMIPGGFRSPSLKVESL